MTRWLSGLLRLGLGIAVAAVCLHFATRDTDWTRVAAELAGARPGWVLAGVAAAVATLVIRAQRWTRLLRPVARVPVGAALAATAIGFASGVILPLRLGELLRPALLARHAPVGMAAALASVVVERLLDALFVALAFLGLSFLHPIPGPIGAGARGLAAIASAGVLGLLLAHSRRAQVDRGVQALLAPLPDRWSAGLRRLIGGLLAGCAALDRLSTLAVVCVWSGVLWAVTALIYYCALRALDIAVPAIPASLASMVIVAAFVFLPQAPALVGTWQAGCVVALGLFGVPQDRAVGFALLTWLVALVPQVALGACFVALERVSWRDLLTARALTPPSEAENHRR